jgi:Asp/Glu/hydantoin racemase
MSGTIYVINPNSNESVTAGIDAAVAPLRSADGPAIACVTLHEGPPGIQSQRDVDGIVGPLLKQAASLENEAAAFVVACFSDPGMHALREQSARPVLGIAECGVLTALTLGQRFGVIAILPTSIPRHLRYFGAMGVLDRFAADLSIGLGVSELSDEQRTLGRMIDVGETLERELGIPVVEPTQAAVTMAVGRVRLGWGGRPFVGSVR